MALVAAQLLPDHILACVLRRLPPRSLAVSRCVCRTWCAVIDDGRLLRTDLLPLSLHGIFFLEGINPGLPEFFADPFMDRKIAAKFDYLDDTDYLHYKLYIEDHCNGLLLLWDQLVINPATRQWARLPPLPPRCATMEEFHDDMCLVFDPAVSPHYEVLFVPYVPHSFLQRTIFTEESEWPPSLFTIPVFTSRTWRWEERSLVRRGEAAGTIADMRSYTQQEYRYDVYWQGAIYLQCQNGSIMRIILSDGEYEVIKSPTCTDFYLGKSKGVCCASVNNGSSCRLQIWFLTDLCGKMEWELKTDISLVPVVTKFSWFSHDEKPGPWMLHESNCDEDGKGALVDDKLEWGFDNGIILDLKDKVEYDASGGDIYFLGFHPYKEIVFFWVSRARVVSCDLSSSKVQDLGRLRLESIGHSFPYTPCWIGNLCKNH